MPLLKIIDLSLQVHLGCAPEERVNPQEIRVSLDLKFGSIPVACSSDQLTDTVCYADICEALKKVAKESEFQTIEFLTETFSSALRAHLPDSATGQIHLHKVNPPIPGLLGGVIYTQELR